ncbi:hypothetical protein EG68_10163 [Paragonimus skrjabini miyazakii]|uniref:Uncharacterized protein n=1 Tax=Paragonimus skrjabini miyazakii TaxID=59628 RepID=A0A8S9YKT6_9TREM|nr:hypothetical protein EG68_10163 [Paragonimus skrjabini miyazakii]
MERQFNRRHGAINHTFSLGQFVLAKNYHDGVEKWNAGRILRRTGRVTYDVEVQSSVRVRHANQLRPSFQPVTVPSNRIIPLDVLLDTFDLSQDVSAAAPNPETHPPSTCTPRRWTDRPQRQVGFIEDLQTTLRWNSVHATEDKDYRGPRQSLL